MKISWFTNVAAPYRVPIWEHIEQRHGLTVHLLEDADSLRREGRRPSDWAGTDSGRYSTVPNFTYRRGERSFYASKRLRLIPRDSDAVLIGAWESPLYFQLLAEATIRSVRKVGFYESTLRSNRHSSGPVAAARSRFLRALDAVVVPGAAAEEAVISFGVDPARIYRGFNAVDVSRFRAAAMHRGVTRTGAGHHFVFIGQLIERKNPVMLLRAFASIARPEDTLTFFGDGELRSGLAELAASLGVSDRVSFEGNQTNADLAAALPAFHTLVLPSTEEVWGLVVNEALAAGLGAVVSDAAGVAASVSGMERVVTVTPDAARLQAGLRRARDFGTTAVRNPEILLQTPERFADVFINALEGVPSVHAG